jgi:hypothetical protein
MGFSTAFKPAGKYAGLPGFSPGTSLGENLTTMERPLSQQTSSLGGSSNPGVVDYFNSLKGSGLPPELINELVRQKALNENSPEIASTSFLEKVYADQNDPVKRQQILDQQLAFDEKRMAKAFPYLMAREIPRQISEGFAQNAALTVLGARNATEAMNQTLAAYPKMSFASVPYQGPQKYFS